MSLRFWNRKTNQQNSPKKSNRFSKIAKIIASWFLALTIALALQKFAFQSYQVFGQSMQPTLHEGDYLIISKLPVTTAKLSTDGYVPARGDIVVLISPVDGTRLIKRVIGLPDERVTVSNGSVRVINENRPQGFDPYSELGIPSEHASGQLSTIVPLGHIFVIGDNREAGGSLDSRNELGPVPIENVIGKLVLRIWPFSQSHSF